MTSAGLVEPPGGIPSFSEERGLHLAGERLNDVRITAPLNGGGPLLRLHSSGGSVRLKGL